MDFLCKKGEVNISLACTRPFHSLSLDQHMSRNSVKMSNKILHKKRIGTRVVQMKRGIVKFVAIQ